MCDVNISVVWFTHSLYKGEVNQTYFPTQNLLSDAESNICKYNAVIINDITLFWRDKSYAEGRLRDRKLARICK